MRPPRLEIDDLHVSVLADGHAPVPILKGVSLAVGPGEVHAIMGPNGSGKSTLAGTLLANPEYAVTQGRIVLDGEELTELAAPDRARRGLFLGFQYPEEIPGVTVLNFLRQALSARKGFDVSVLEVRVALLEWTKRLEIDDGFLKRYLNEGFSGGEKKRNEILQMALLEPEVAVLDETDSGLDIDALRVVASGVNEVRRARPDMGVVLITHYHRLLDHVAPDMVHVLVDGRIVESGGPELAQTVEREGYESRREASAARGAA